MKTVKEKMAVVDEFNRLMLEMQPLTKKAVEGDDDDKLTTAYAMNVKICRPVLQMYIEEIQNAVNPVNSNTAFIVVAALEIITDGIKRLGEVDDGLVDALRFGIGVDTTKISAPKEFWREVET